MRNAFAVAGAHTARTGALRAALSVPHGAGQRNVPRPELFPRDTRASRADSADVSVHQGMGRGLQQRRRVVVARGAVRRGEHRGAHAILCDGHQRRGVAAGGERHLSAGAHGGLQPELPRGGRQTFVVGLLSRGVRRGEVLADAQVARRVRGSQPRHRQRVSGSAPRFVPQRADLFRSRVAGPRARTVQRFARAARLSRTRQQGKPALSRHTDRFADFNARERLYQKV